ncbi:response regulator transcription factor [Burkholderia stabilis]|uniref:response regulator transcription factor n=1 Tax=Burkholderia stabilis TaxID=95485 RepID=UPI0015885CAE|nr:response regulator transcription factor [Burkholderia stabilis]
MNPKIVIADDHPIIVAGLQQIISKSTRYTVAGVANNGRDLLTWLKQGACDILILDYSMPKSTDPDGYLLVELIRRNYPRIKILLLTMLNSPMLLRRLDGLQVEGLVSKSDAFADIGTALDAVSADKIYRSPTMRKLLSGGHWPSDADSRDLSARELEVLRLLSDGLSVTEIAEKLSKSIKTISTQKMSAMRKLGVSTDLDLHTAIRFSNIL